MIELQNFPYIGRQFYYDLDNSDVTDNKTSDLVFQAPLTTMNDIFHREDERLRTFENWPLSWLDKKKLAQTGMFYTGDEDKVKCYFCEVEIGRWELGDLPVPEHLRWSPNCPLLRRRTTNNAPIDVDELNQILPTLSYDICGANDAIEVRNHNSSSNSSNSDSNRNSSSSNSSIGSNSSNANDANYHPQQNTAMAQSPELSPRVPYTPVYPEYAICSARLRSFIATWPPQMTQTPIQMAEAGFFHSDNGDRVKCFSCGGGLKDWDANDDPWEEHALWMPKCRFVKLMKGQSFIDAVLAKHAQQLQQQHQQQPNEKDKEQPSCSLQTRTQTAAPPTTSNNTDNIPEEKLCKICYACEYNTAFSPCGHVVACAKCASSVTKCPMCRKPFTDMMRVYFS